VIFISISLIYTAFKGLSLRRILRLNFKDILDVNLFDSVEMGHLCEGDIFSDKENKNHETEKKKNREIFFLFTLVNYVANFLIIILIANIQIINRVATCNPILFIYCSELIMKYKKQQNRLGKFMLIVFISYSIIGCIMHSGSYGYA